MLYKTLLSLYLWMYFIIIHSSNLEYFLFVKRLFYKGEKSHVESLYVIVILNSKNDKGLWKIWGFTSKYNGDYSYYKLSYNNSSPVKLGCLPIWSKKLRALTIGKCFLGQNQTKKTDKIEVHVSPSTLVIFLNLPAVQSNGRWL